MFPDDLVGDLRETYAKHASDEASDEDFLGIEVVTHDELRDFHTSKIAEVEFPPLKGYRKRSAVLAIWWGWTTEEYFSGRNRGQGASPDADGTTVPPPPPPPAPKPTVNATPPPPPQPSRYWPAADDFLRLADRLGAHLTPDIRRTLVSGKTLSVRPAALWCLLLFKDFVTRSNIPQEDLEDMCGGRMLPQGHPWYQPLSESLDLVERLEAGDEVADGASVDENATTSAANPALQEQSDTPETTTAVPKKLKQRRVKGVTLQDAAGMLSRGTEVECIKRWHNSRCLPISIGKDSQHIQKNLYRPAELLESLKIIEGFDVSEHPGLETHLNEVKRLPREIS